MTVHEDDIMDDWKTYTVKYTARNMHAYYTGEVQISDIENDPEAKAMRLIRRDVGPGLLIEITSIEPN
jgi:hypothetical protein